VLLGPEHRPGVRGVAPELTPVANRPIVNHALCALGAAGIGDATLIGPPTRLAGVERALAAETNDRPSIQYIEQPAPRGALDALQLAEPLLQERPFVVQFADALLRDQLRPLVSSLSADPPDALVLLKKRRGKPSMATSLELAGFYLFGPGAAHAIAQIGVRAGAQELPAIVQALAERGGRIERRCVEGSWRYCGDVRELLEANRFLLDGIAGGAPPESMHNSRIQGRALIDASAELTSAVIRGPVIIGPGAKIREAYVGPYTSIGANVVVEASELEHSIVLPGARIADLGVRLDGSVVGADARVCRGFRRPTALRLQVRDGAEVSLA
jgi:glucose-1-phosphate thymidylyltransferase